MGCNCGQKTQQFKNLVKQSAVPQKMSRAERIRLRSMRMAARDARIKARNDEAERIRREAQGK